MQNKRAICLGSSSVRRLDPIHFAYLQPVGSLYPTTCIPVRSIRIILCTKKIQHRISSFWCRTVVLSDHVDIAHTRGNSLFLILSYDRSIASSKIVFHTVLSRAVFLNRRTAAQYRPLETIIPGRERFSWNLSF